MFELLIYLIKPFLSAILIFIFDIKGNTPLTILWSIIFILDLISCYLYFNKE